MADTTKRLQVILGADTSSYQKEFKKASGATNSLGKSLDTIEKQVRDAFKDSAGRLGKVGEALSSIGPAGFAAAAGLGAVAGAAALAGKAILDVVDKAGKLTDLSTKTSLSTGFLQDLDFVASQVGVSLEDAAGAAGKLQKTLGAALSGNAEAIAAFKAIGIEVENLRGQKFEDVLALTFQALGQVTDESVQVARGTELMGKSFSSTANLVRSDLVTAFEQARASGTRLTDEEIKNADDLGDAITRLGKTTEALKDAIGVELLEGLSGGDAAAGVDGITQAVRGLIATVKDDKFQAFLNVLTGGAAGGLLGALQFGVKKLAQAAPPTILSDEAIAKKSAVTGPDLFTELSQDQGLVAKAKARAEEQKKAQAEATAEAKKFEAELERIQKVQEGLDFEEWVSGRKKIEEANAALAKAQEAIFGSSAESTAAAMKDFAAFQQVLENTGKTINDLSEDELANYARQLEEADKATRSNAEANAKVREQLIAVYALIDQHDLAAEFEKPKQPLEELAKVTYDWHTALEDAANAMQLLGVRADSDLGRLVGGFLQAASAAQNLQKQIEATKKATGKGSLDTNSKIAVGQQALGIGVDAFQGADTNVGRSTGKGALSGAARGAALGSVIPGVGTVVGGVVGGVIGAVGGFLGAKKKIKQALRELNDQLIQQFGSMEKARAAAKKYGIDLDKALASKKPDQLAKAMNDLAKATQKAADKITGLETARDSIQQLQDQVAESTNEKLKAAVGALASKVSDELAKAGLGFLENSALRGSEQFQGAKGISQSTAATLGGLRQAGVVDQGVLDAAKVIAEEARKQAFEAAKAAGLSDQEATKASFGAVSDLLREQLNAELQANGKISDQLQKQLDEAKANGIEILADPAIESLNVQKDQLDVLKQIAGGKGSAKGKIAENVPQFAEGSGGFRNFGSGTTAVLHGIEGVFRPQDIQLPSLGQDVPTFQMRGGEWGDSSIMPVSMPAVNITVNGNPSRNDRDAIEKSVARGIRLGQADLMAALDVWAGRKGGRR